MTQENIQDIAAALYDGGWRSADYMDMQAEYDLTLAEAEEIRKQLEEYENE